MWVIAALAVASPTVEGFVLDAGGRGVREAVVRVDEVEVRTGADGGFGLTVRPGRRALVVTLPSGAVHRSPVFTVPARGGVEVIVAAGDEVRFLFETAEVEAGPAAAVTATVTGRVRAGERPLVGARVFVAGADAEADTDADGRFALRVPLGPGELVLIHPDFVAPRLAIDVPPAGLALDLEAEPRVPELEELVVLAPRVQGTTELSLRGRRESAGVTEVLGADQIAKAGDGDAAAALRRVTGVTIVGGKYAYVRGLGERYSGTLLDGARLSSPDPERRVVPLDLFPTHLLSTVEVEKTYRPSLPGEFGGGLVALETRGVPSRFSLGLGVSGGYRLASTGATAGGYEGAALDALTFGGAARDLPADFAAASRERVFRLGDRFTPGYTAAELERFGESLALDFGLVERTVPPDFGVSVELEAPLSPFGRRGGLGLGVSLGNDFAKRTSLRRTYAAGLVPQNDFPRVEELTRQATLSGIAALGLEPAEGLELRLTLLASRMGEDSARLAAGTSEEDGAAVEITRLLWVEQLLGSARLAGRHPLFGLTVDWRYALSVSTRDEPDRREIKYVEDRATGGLVFSTRASGNQRFYSSLLDLGHDLGLDLDLPISLLGDEPSHLRVGASFAAKDRDVESRRYRYELDASPEARAALVRLGPREIFRPSTIGAGGFRLEEVTLPDDRYLAAERVFGAYVEGELALGPALRLLAGARLEVNAQSVRTTSPLGDGARLASERLELDVMPALTATYRLHPGLQLRAAYARTVNRPNFRELSPTRYFDLTLGTEFRGTPELGRATIDHADLRLEWYPSEGESVSLAAFGKRFTDPIETTVFGGASWVYRPTNVPSARNLGLELEARKTFAFLGEALAPLSAQVNASLVWSEVSLGGGQAGLTSAERPLAGQSPYTVNAALAWDDPDAGRSIQLSFNVFGPRIDSVGAFGIPDVIEAPFPSLDLVVRQRIGRVSLSAKATNLLDAEVEYALADGAPTERYRPRPAVSASLSVDLD